MKRDEISRAIEEWLSARAEWFEAGGFRFISEDVVIDEDRKITLTSGERR